MNNLYALLTFIGSTILYYFILNSTLPILFKVMGLLVFVILLLIYIKILKK